MYFIFWKITADKSDTPAFLFFSTEIFITQENYRRVELSLEVADIFTRVTSTKRSTRLRVWECSIASHRIASHRIVSRRLDMIGYWCAHYRELHSFVVSSEGRARRVSGRQGGKWRRKGNRSIALFNYALKIVRLPPCSIPGQRKKKKKKEKRKKEKRKERKKKLRG